VEGNRKIVGNLWDGRKEEVAHWKNILECFKLLRKRRKNANLAKSLFVKESLIK
jgi:hypothetical protein